MGASHGQDTGRVGREWGELGRSRRYRAGKKGGELKGEPRHSPRPGAPPPHLGSAIAAAAPRPQPPRGAAAPRRQPAAATRVHGAPRRGVARVSAAAPPGGAGPGQRSAVAAGPPADQARWPRGENARVLDSQAGAPAPFADGVPYVGEGQS